MCIVCSLQVECIRLPTDTGTSRLKGFGYAEFKDVDNLLAAVQLNSEVSWPGGGGQYDPNVGKIKQLSRRQCLTGSNLK